ncbi:aminotransferase class V-fold PLP-dependent enzyme [bacterium]|nr:aminotransferase class V-fold PLP-dependent enzyme [bacterium]
MSDGSQAHPVAAATGRRVYLDNAATSFPKPEPVIEAVRTALGHSLTVARSTHLAEFRGDEVLKRCRIKLAKFFGAESAEEMIYTYSATDGLNIVLNGVIKPGSHVITTPLEHHSVMRPLHHLRQDAGVSWSTLPADGMGVVDPAAIKGLVRPETSAIVINWVSNVSGTMQPVAEIGRIANELGLPYIVDAAQATGTHPVDVKEIGCQAMAQPAHKALMSLPGMGVLYLSRALDCKPWRIGGTGYRSDLVMQPEDRPVKYEAGTVNVPGVVGLDAAMDWFEQTGVKRIRSHCATLVSRLYEGLSELPGVTVIGPYPSEDRGFVVSFTVDDQAGAPVDPLVVSQLLAEQHGISTRAGLHCAPPAHRHFGTLDRGGTVRFSVSYFTTPADAEYALKSVREVVAGL